MLVGFKSYQNSYPVFPFVVFQVNFSDDRNFHWCYEHILFRITFYSSRWYILFVYYKFTKLVLRERLGISEFSNRNNAPSI